MSAHDPDVAAARPARLDGDDAPGLGPALGAVGVQLDESAASLVFVALVAPPLDELEDALNRWVIAARAAALADGDVVTIVADGLLDSDDVAACAYGHGLVAATRAYAMERERSGGIANAVAVDPASLDEVATTLRWLLHDRSVSGDLLRTGARTHGRQRL